MVVSGLAGARRQPSETAEFSEFIGSWKRNGSLVRTVGGFLRRGLLALL